MPQLPAALQSEAVRRLQGRWLLHGAMPEGRLEDPQADVQSYTSFVVSGYHQDCGARIYLVGWQCSRNARMNCKIVRARPLVASTKTECLRSCVVE